MVGADFVFGVRAQCTRPSTCSGCRKAPASGCQALPRTIQGRSRCHLVRFFEAVNRYPDGDIGSGPLALPWRRGRASALLAMASRWPCLSRDAAPSGASFFPQWPFDSRYDRLAPLHTREFFPAAWRPSFHDGPVHRCHRSSCYFSLPAYDGWEAPPLT